jgi:diaminopimelate epimerase
MTILTKCNALGNDFLILDCINHAQNNEFLTEENIKRIAHRLFGIGCDQFIVLEKSEKADGKIIFYNTDGSRAEACGNGTVACGVYVSQFLKKPQISLETDVKIAKCVINGNEATVELPKAEVLGFDSEKFAEKLVLDLFVTHINSVSVGNPHCVIFWNDNEIIATKNDFAEIGKTIENLTEIFPNRTNVEFVVQTGENAFDCFIWERGSGATLACGTGACAVARAAVHNKLADETKPIFVTMAGSYQGGETIPMKVELQNTCTLFTNTVSLVGKVSL